METWEKDLRNQLNGLKAKPKSRKVNLKKEPWEDNLLKDIGVKPQQSSSWFFNIVIILALVILLGFIYNNKTGYFTNLMKNNDFAVVDGPEHPRKKEEKSEKASPKENTTDLEALKRRMEEMDKNIKWGNDRITLLTAVTQDNFISVKNGSRDFIYLNGDWKLDRLPKNLKLTDEDIKFLNQFYVN